MRNLKITKKGMKAIWNDDQYEECILEGVTDDGDDWTLKTDMGYLSVPKIKGFVPTAGMRAYFFGKGFGHSVRGVVVEKTPIYYRTIEEAENDHKRYCKKMDSDRAKRLKKNLKNMDADYNALPDVFKKRIDGFRKANPNFRRDYEGYEIFTIKEAIKIANALKDPAKVHEFYEKPFEEQAKMVVGLDEGHSGNTFGCACQLARMYLESPETVLKMHGALVPVVGCEAYGCKHEKV